MAMLLPPRPDALLLDLDGTLSASGPMIVAGIQRALAHVGADPIDSEALQAWLGPPLADSFAAIPGIDPARAVAAYRAAYDPLEAPLFDGIPQTLHALRERGVRLALATSKPQAYAEVIVRGKGLAPLLEVVVGWDDAAGRTTKGNCVGEALRQLGAVTAPVMVGDRSHDVEGAAEHGVPCIGALWGYGSREELSGAAALIERPGELLQAVRQDYCSHFVG